MAAAAQRNPSKIMSMNPDRLSDSDAKYQHLASSKAGVPLLNYAWVVTSLIQARLSLDTSFAAVAKYFLLEGEKSGKKHVCTHIPIALQKELPMGFDLDFESC